MCIVKLGVSVGLRSPRGPTMSTTLELIPQLPIPAAIGTVPPRWVTRSLSCEDIVSVLYRAEPLVSYPFREVRGSAVGRIWMVNPNEFVVFKRTTLENVNLRKATKRNLASKNSHLSFTCFWFAPLGR